MANSNHSKRQLRGSINEIDNDVTKALLKAEQRTASNNRPPWSPELKEASLQVKRLKLILRQFTHNTNHTNAIISTTSRMNNTNELPDPRNRKECQTALRKAQKLLRQIRSKAQEKRAQYLDTLVSKYELTGDRERQRIIQRIRKAEATKRCYQKLRSILNPPKPGVTFVQRRTEHGKTDTLYDRTDIEQAILERNQRHFNQCAGTAFTIGTMRALNWAADSKLADSILDGTCQIQSITKDTNLQFVLQQCKRLCKEVPTSITTSNLRSLFKCWHETTTTSPSGRHIGIYKTIFNQNDDDCIIQIANNIALLLETLLKNGIGLNRWRRVINMMIHKLEGSFLLDKLRVIHIFEADYNGSIGLLFNRQLLYAAEQQNLLNNNQWGCRPHRQAEDALLLKELTYNLAVTTKTTLATFDNDATGCFDRVPCTVAMLASRRLGATKNMCQMQADTLEYIQHQLKTAFGLSKDTYHSTQHLEIHGQGQGSRAGPPTWVFVSSLLLDCMEKLTTGVTFTCPFQETTHHRHNDAFVDDVTGYANHFLAELNGRNVVSRVIQTMQQDATTWNNLLATSGGKLALHKCLYYILSWEWTGGQAIPIQPNDSYQSICLPSDDTTNVPIKQLPCHISHRTLGQMKSPSNNQSAQLQLMMKRSRTWLNAIQESALTRTEAQAAYSAIWFPSLSYGLGTTNLTQQELDKIQKPIINYILPKLGYNRHFPRAVVYGSPRFGGLNFKHLYTDQGIKHVTHFVKHYRTNNSIGQLLRISTRWIRLVAGFSFCPLSRPQTNYHHIGDPWFQTTMRFLAECNASIETCDNTPVFSRENDSCLMEDFMLFPLTKTKMIWLNQCRLYLHVTSLSDITTADGTSILCNCWDGSVPVDSPLLWPIQAKPCTKAWQTWRFFLAQCYLTDDTNRHIKRLALHLQSPLGQWLPTHRHRQTRLHYINPVNYTLYTRSGQFYQVSRPVRTTRTQLHMRQTGTTSYLPQCTHPIQIQHHTKDSLRIDKQDIVYDYMPHRETSATCFEEYISLLPLWEQELLATHSFNNRSAKDALSLLDQPIVIATDGSAESDKGSFGWVLTDASGDIIAQGQGIAYGPDVSSFRCEGYGILAIARFIIRLRYYFHHPSPNNITTWWCDCKSLIQRLAQSDIPANPNRAKLAEHDLEFAIRASIPLLTARFRPKHLHSHQADNIPLHRLPLHLRLNRIADQLAKQHNDSITETTNKVPLITPSACQINIRGKTITRSIPRHLTAAFTHSTSITHIRHRLNIASPHISSIAWKEFARALSSLPLGQQRIIRRWIYGFLPTQLRLHRYKSATSPTCPLCQSHPETDNHFLTCGGADSWQDTLFLPLEKICRKHHATHWVEHTITTNLIHTLQRTTPRTQNPWIQPAFDTQQQLGWSNALYGIFGKAWIRKQNESRPHNPNGSTFITAVIKTIFVAIVGRWNERNQYLHRKQQHCDEIHHRVSAKVRALYECQPLVLLSDQIIFSTPLHELLLRPTKTLQLFVEQNERIIKQSIKTFHHSLARQHHDISSYFHQSRARTTRTKPTRVTNGKDCHQ